MLVLGTLAMLTSAMLPSAMLPSVMLTSVMPINATAVTTSQIAKAIMPPLAMVMFVTDSPTTALVTITAQTVLDIPVRTTTETANRTTHLTAQATTQESPQLVRAITPQTARGTTLSVLTTTAMDTTLLPVMAISTPVQGVSLVPRASLETALGITPQIALDIIAPQPRAPQPRASQPRASQPHVHLATLMHVIARPVTQQSFSCFNLQPILCPRLPAGLLAP